MKENLLPQESSGNPKPVRPARRKFLSGAGAAAAGAATLGFPMISVAQSPISLRWQSTWPAKDIFHEYALDYAKLVNEMSCLLYTSRCV